MMSILTTLDTASSVTKLRRKTVPLNHFVHARLVLGLFCLFMELTSPKTLENIAHSTMKVNSWDQGNKLTLNDTKQNGMQGIHSMIKFNEALFGSQVRQSSHHSMSYLVVHHTLRLIVLVACIVGCFAQIVAIMNIFFSYPAIVFVDLYQMEKLFLPGITICNDNRVMRSKLSSYNEDFAYKWDVLANKTKERHNQGLKLYQQQLIDNLIRAMLTNLTVAEFMSFGNTADDFLDKNFFRCASDKNHQNQKCIHLSNLLTSAQENGNCFTLFHKSESNELEQIAINSGLSESAVVRGSINESVDIEMSIKPFSPNEIMRFRVNFHEEEYTTLNEPVSGQFIIHDNSQVAVIREKSYRIVPGKYYIFYISKLTDQLLPSPYVTDCRDYEKVTVSKDNKMFDNNQTSSTQRNESVNILFRDPSSKANCIIGCIAKKTIKTCNCWPPELPFIVNGMNDTSESSLKWCDWRERPPIDPSIEKPNHLTWFQYCFNVHENDCNKECKSDCRIDRYRILKEEIEWPSRERIIHSEDREELLRLRTCCSVISVRYWSAEQKINRYKPRFETAEFTSYIGGLLSMWLGFSLFGFYNLSEKAIIRLINRRLKKRKEKSKIKTPSLGGQSEQNRGVSYQSYRSIMPSNRVQGGILHRRQTPSLE